MTLLFGVELVGERNCWAKLCTDPIDDDVDFFEPACFAPLGPLFIARLASLLCSSVAILFISSVN